MRDVNGNTLKHVLQRRSVLSTVAYIALRTTLIAQLPNKRLRERFEIEHPRADRPTAMAEDVWHAGQVAAEHAKATISGKLHNNAHSRKLGVKDACIPHNDKVTMTNFASHFIGTSCHCSVAAVFLSEMLIS